MVNLASTEVFVFPVDRQDLFNLWANATMGTFSKSELDESLFTHDVGTAISDATSTPQPGHVFWSKLEGLMYVYHDEVDNTGVSLWLAIGPDRFDVACIAAAPIGSGSIVRPVVDRWVHSFTGASNRPERQRAIGTVPAQLDVKTFNPVHYATAGGTTASGSWVPVSIDGIVWSRTTGNIEADRWVRCVDGSLGQMTTTEAGAGPRPLRDDSLGMGILTIVNPDTYFPQFLWTGPRVINALDT